MKRISFPDWQAEHRSRPGDTLCSQTWKYKRLVRAMDAFAVTLTEILPNGRHHNVTIVKSLPSDTKIQRD